MLLFSIKILALGFSVCNKVSLMSPWAGQKMDLIRLDFTKACSLQEQCSRLGQRLPSTGIDMQIRMQTHLWMPLSKLPIPFVNDKSVKPYRNPLLKMFPLSLCSSTLLGESSTVRALRGFPSKENPYARLSPNHVPETLLVMTRLEVSP